MGVAGQSYNQPIGTAQAAQPQKVHQKEEKGSAAEAAACKFSSRNQVASWRSLRREAALAVNSLRYDVSWGANYIVNDQLSLLRSKMNIQDPTRPAPAEILRSG